MTGRFDVYLVVDVLPDAEGRDLRAMVFMMRNASYARHGLAPGGITPWPRGATGYGSGLAVRDVHLGRQTASCPTAPPRASSQLARSRLPGLRAVSNPRQGRDRGAHDGHCRKLYNPMTEWVGWWRGRLDWGRPVS